MKVAKIHIPEHIVIKIEIVQVILLIRHVEFLNKAV